jgi:hypothetical protein
MASAPAARSSALALICAGGIAATAGAQAGCFSDRGVAIEVDVGDSGATKVELFLGMTACDKTGNAAGIACTTIAPPPDGSVPLAGEIWFRDTGEPYIVEVRGGKATFQIRAESQTDVPIAAAVGYAADAAAPGGLRPVGIAAFHDLSIPAHAARVITTEMVAAKPVQLAPADTRNLSESRVMVWRKPATAPAASCLVAEQWDQGAVQRVIIVPEDDADCDGVPAPECNPAAYLGTNRVGGVRDRPECFTSSGGPACALGAFGCKDNVAGNDQSCFPLPARTCVPDALCSCSADDAPCWRGLLSPEVNPVARIECRVPTKLATVGKLDLCPGKSEAAIDLSAFFAPTKCPQPELAALPGLSFDKAQSFGGVKMELSSLSGKPCQFTVSWATGVRSTAEPPEDFGVLRFARDDPGEASLLLPIAFRFLADTCLTSEFVCSYAPPVTASIDGMWSCVQ